MSWRRVPEILDQHVRQVYQYTVFRHGQLPHLASRNTGHILVLPSIPPNVSSSVAHALPSMEVVSPGVNGHVPSSATTGAIDPDAVVQHLADLLEVTIGASREDLERHGSMLSVGKRNDTIQRCTRFASEPQVALYVQKAIGESQQRNGDPSTAGG